MIRRATVEDTSMILNMVRNFINHSPYGHFTVDESKLLELIGYWNLPANRLFVLDVDGTPVGMLAATTNEFLFNRERIASEMAWWVEPSYRGRGGLQLKAAFEDWARSLRVKYIHMASLDTPRVNQMYERNGYRKTECTFVKEI